MPFLVEERIAQLRRRARRLCWLHAWGWTLALVLGVGGALALADYLVRYEDFGLRLIASAVLLAAMGHAVWRFLRPVWRHPLTDLQVAQRIERRYPRLNDRLSSALEFLKQAEHDPTAGSAVLRQAVIAQSDADLERLDLDEVTRTTPAMQAVLASGAVALVVLILALLNIPAAGTAIVRLLNPLAAVRWPQQNHLVVENPIRRLALGETFEIKVVDQGGEKNLPDQVMLHLRYGGGDQAAEEVIPMQYLDGGMVFRKENVRRPFSYRAVGGDDGSMEPIALEVVEPPTLETLELTIHPPAYTGWPVTRSSDKNPAALAGSRIEFRGTTTKPLGSAKIQLNDAEPLAAVLSEDRHGFTLPVQQQESDLIVKESGAYRILLQDAEMADVVGGKDKAYDVRVTPDTVPTLTIDQPGSTGFVTPEADIPLRVTAKDDLAIKSIAWVFIRSDKSDDGPQTFEIYSGPAEVAALAEDAPRDEGEVRVAEARWNLAPLGLPPGTILTFHAAGTDYLPQTGQSQPGRLHVISHEELEARLAERQTFILSELSRVLKMERDARNQVTSLETQAAEMGQLTKQDVDQLQGAEMNQRQVDRNLTSETEGLPLQIRSLLNDLQNNKVDNPDMIRRMEALRGELARLERQHLPAISQGLTRALKDSQTRLDRSGNAAPDKTAPRPAPGPDAEEPAEPDETPPAAPDKEPAAEDPKEDPTEEPTAEPAAQPNQKTPLARTQRPRGEDPVSDSLAQAGENQDEVIGTLERMLNELSKSESFGRVYRELGHLRNDQESLAQATDDAAKQTLGRDARDLTPQQLTDLKKLAERQRELARRLEKIEDRLDDLKPKLAQDDPLAADAVADAARQSREQALTGKLQEAGNALENNQLGDAKRQQQQAAQSLQELMDTLANRREQELSRLVEKLREAEQQLRDLQERQAELRRKLQQAQQIEDPAERQRELERLTRQEKELKEEAQRLGRRLERLQADKAGKQLAKASQKMGQAGDQGDQGDAAGAEEQAEQAEQDLEDAQQELAERRKQAEVDLAMEQLAKIEDSLRALHARQKGAVDELDRLSALLEKEDRLTRSQWISVQELGRTEKSLSEETTILAKKLAPAEVFNLALKGIARQLDRAGEALDGQQLDAGARDPAESALRRLQQLLTSLAEDKRQKPKKSQPAGEQQGEGGNQQQPRDGIPPLAQLRLLKLMQVEINERTSELNRAAEGQELTDAQKQEYTELSQEQGQLADLLFNLSQPADDQAEEGMGDDEDPAEEPAKEEMPAGESDDLDLNLDDLKLEDLKLDDQQDDAEKEKSPDGGEEK